MYTPKESILALLDEAESLIFDFERTVRDYKANSYRLVRHDDLEIGKAEYCLQDVKQPPLSLATKILGIGTYLRAPMDHAVTELLRKSGSVKKSKAPGFPICTSDQEWKNNVNKIEGITGPPADFILSVQPFKVNDRDSVHDHPLAALNLLRNSSNHKVTLVVEVTVAESTQHRLTANRHLQWVEYFSSEFEEGAKMAVMIPAKPSTSGVTINSLEWTGGGSKIRPGFSPRAFVGGAVMGDMLTNNIEADFQAIQKGSGKWGTDGWNTFFEGVQFDLKIAQNISFGKGSGSLEGLPVIETLHGIRRYLKGHIFHEDGLIKGFT